jgi:hypothetical protein
MTMDPMPLRAPEQATPPTARTKRVVLVAEDWLLAGWVAPDARR